MLITLILFYVLCILSLSILTYLMLYEANHRGVTGPDHEMIGAMKGLIFRWRTVFAYIVIKIMGYIVNAIESLL